MIMKEVQVLKIKNTKVYVVASFDVLIFFTRCLPNSASAAGTPTYYFSTVCFCNKLTTVIYNVP